jgi:hypothetical protein
MKTHLVWICIAVAAFLIGTRLGKKENHVVQTASETTKKASEDRQPMAPSEQRPSTSPAAQEQLNVSPLAGMNMLRDLKRRQVALIRLPVVYNNGKLSEGFAELFSLTQNEKETLRRAIEDARLEIGRLSFANAKVTRDGNSTIVIVQPFDGGADIYDRLMDSFQRTLGADRYSAMVELHTDELPRVFSGFGAEKRTIAISYDPTSKTFRLQDNRKTVSGYSNRTESFSDLSDLSDLNRWLAPILQRMPPPGTSPDRL